jgi:hypothetical protein
LLKKYFSQKRVLLFVTVLFLLEGAAIFLLSRNALLTTDAHRYALLANNIVRGRGYTLFGHPEYIFPPGYSFLVFPFVLLGLSLQDSVAALMGFSLFMTGFFSFLLLKRVFNLAMAAVASLLLVFNGQVIYWAVQGYVEVIMMAFLLGTFYFLIRSKDSDFFVSGIFASISYLLKPESLIYIAVFVFLLIFETVLKGKGKIINFLSFRKILPRNKAICFFVLPVLLTIFSYSLFQFKFTGKFEISGKFSTFYWDSYIEHPEYSRDQITMTLRPDYTIGLNPKEVSTVSLSDIESRVYENLKSYKKSVFELLLPLRLSILSVAIIFLILKKERKHMLYIFLFGLPTLVVLFFHVENRYLISVLVANIFLLSIPLAGNVLKSRFRFLAAIFGLFTLLELEYYSFLPIRKEYAGLVDENRKITNFVAENIGNLNTLSRKPVYSFYAKTDYYPLPWTGRGEKLLEYLKVYKDSDTLIVLDDWSKNTIPFTDSFIKKEKGKIPLDVVVYEN